MRAFGTFGVLALVAVWAAAVVGWILNIVAVVHMLGDVSVTPMFIARIVGVFLAPIGAVLGYF